MIERDIENYLVKRVKQLGGEVRKVKWIGRRHAPDRLVMLPYQTMTFTSKKNPASAITMTTGKSTIWVELKKPGAKPRIGQVREHERMRKLGQRVVVIDSIEGVDDLLS